jgi:hypothetical protein
MHLHPSTYNAPADIYQLVDFIGALSILVNVLLGVKNQVAISLRSHLRLLDLHRIRYQEMLMAWSFLVHYVTCT